MARDEPSDWQFKPLEELDQLLRCPICFEFYRTAMMLPQCSHNFCSLCIRRYITVGNSKCPMCAVPVAEGDLKNNRLIDQIIHNFKSSRKDLLSIVRNRSESGDKERVGGCEEGKEREGGLRNKQQSSHDAHSNRYHGKRRLYSVPEPPQMPDSEAFVDDVIANCDGVPLVMGVSVKSEDGAVERGDTVVRSPSFLSSWQPPDVGGATELFGGVMGEGVRSEVERALSTSLTPSQLHTKVTPLTSSTPSLSHTHSLTSSTHPLSHTHPKTSVASSASSEPSSSDKVDCPICGQLVLARFINRHLDTICLKKSDSAHSDTQKRYAKVPKLVYQLMKDRQLKSKLKEYHLPTHGDRQALVGRLKEFILRFNAQCDSLDPRPHKEIAREVEQEERQRESNRQPRPSPVTRVKREMTTDEVVKKNREYVVQHKYQFAHLITKVRESSLERERRDEGEREEDTPNPNLPPTTTERVDRDVLAEDSTNSDVTPPLEREMEGSAGTLDHRVPESPPPVPAEPRVPRKKRRHWSSPSPPSEGDRGSDEEFIIAPPSHHHQTPSSHHHQTPSSHHPQTPSSHHHQTPSSHHHQTPSSHHHQTPSSHHHQTPSSQYSRRNKRPRR